MREKKAACLKREMEQLTTEQLDALLQNELPKESPNENVVLPILKVLEERERDYPVEVSDQVRSAWERYQKRVSTQQNASAGRARPFIKWFATAAAVFCLMVIAFPFAADADSALDVLYHVTDSIVEFFRPGGGNTDSAGEYIFETDNPGLQQLYDKVVELGATVPVVPMWLPDGYALEELETTVMPNGTKTTAIFVNGDKSIVIQVKVSESISSTQYEQEDGVEIYDVSKIKHLVFNNEDYMSVMWYNENVEGHINITENKDTLKKIIESIYRRK